MPLAGVFLDLDLIIDDAAGGHRRAVEIDPEPFRRLSVVQAPPRACQAHALSSQRALELLTKTKSPLRGLLSRGRGYSDAMS